jgi:hypothetical protein
MSVPFFLVKRTMITHMEVLHYVLDHRESDGPLGIVEGCLDEDF